MNCYFLISIIIGIALIFYSFRLYKNLKDKIKTTAIYVGRHRSNNSKGMVARVEFSINNVKRECDLSFYIWKKKGQKIIIYYNPDKYWDISCLEEIIFIFILGLVFIIVSIIAMFVI